MFCGSLASAKDVARLVTRVAFAAGLMLLGGCIDYAEEMWLNSDLSGRMAMNISVKEEIVRGITAIDKGASEDAIRRELERIPGVKLESFESFRDTGRVIGKIRLAFDSIEKLAQHDSRGTGSSLVSFLGTFTTHAEGGKVNFVRSLPSSKAKSTGEDMLAKGLGSLLFSKNYIAYKLHVPGELITANSPHSDAKTRMIEWRFTLAQAIREPPTMRVEWKKSFPWLWILISTLAVLASVALIPKTRR